MGQGSGISRGRPGWDDLKNSLVFSWGFFEMMVWFWVSLGALREREGFFLKKKIGLFSPFECDLNQGESGSRMFANFLGVGGRFSSR